MKGGYLIMKRVVAILLAGVMVFGLAMTAYAADSPTADTTETLPSATIESGDSDDVGDWDVVVSTTYPTEEEEQAAADLAADPITTLEEVVGDDDSIDTSSLTLATVMDVSIVGDTTTYDGSAITISFSYPGILLTSTVVVLHYTNGAWQQEPFVLSIGIITVTFSSLSPVAIYVDESTLGEAEEETAASSEEEETTASSEEEEETTASGSDESAEVGDSAAVPFAFLLSAMAVCGIVISVRSLKKNRA